ncbi:MAG: CRTAC1 family protein, partial [Chloroflexi bacterium]|nr:CRTAC1 family protein [Chloroflexota bacterium]
TFREIAHELGVDVGHPDEAPHLGNKTFTTWFFDYDNDGWLDLYVGGYGSSLSAWAADYAGLPTTGNRLRLYKNEGGRFRNVTREVGLYRILLPMGANYGDVDSDGFPDIFLGTGKPGFEFLIPKMLYRNVSGRRFADVTTEAGVGHLQKGHGVAFGDVDHDGDQDLFAQMGAFYPADAFRDAFYENPGNGNHWITIVLRGVRTNRFGIGARIRADVTTAAGPRSIHALAGAGGSFGGSSLQQEIGLGDAEEIDRLEIWWPASGVRQVLEHVAVDQFVAITEGEPGFQVLERPRIRLAAQD